MTDKVQKIRKEVERIQLYTQSDVLKQILDYIDKVQEEPVSEDEAEKQFNAGDVVMYVSRHPAYSGLYLLGNPNDLSIGYSNANEPYQIVLRNCTVASEDERKQFMRELNDNGYKWNESTLSIEEQEPVSEELGEYINELSKQFPEVSFAKLSRIAVRAAKWQKQQDQSIIELAEDHAVLAGMEKMKEQMMTKAVDAKLLEGHLIRQKGVTHPLHVGDKVKVIVIKED